MLELEPFTTPGFGCDKDRWSLFQAAILTTFSLIAVKFPPKFLSNCGEKSNCLDYKPFFYVFAHIIQSLTNIFLTVVKAVAVYLVYNHSLQFLV